MTKSNSDNSSNKIYNLKTILTATILGSPLTTGILVYHNYKTLGQIEKGRNFLLFSIVFTILIFGGFFLLPETIIDKIPNYFISGLYTIIYYFIIKKNHDKDLENHFANRQPFYSIWKGVGVSIVVIILLVVIIFTINFSLPENRVYRKYDIEMKKFSTNEEETLKFYNDINYKNNEDLLNDLEQNILPKWKKNIELIKSTNQWKNLPIELKEQNKHLLIYSELRVQAFELIRKSIAEDTDQYANEIDKIHYQIDNQLILLESLYH